MTECCLPACERQATVAVGTPGQICGHHLSRRTTKPGQPWGVDSITQAMSERRCINCGSLMVAAMVNAEPDHDTHPACDTPTAWLKWQPGRPTVRWSRR